MTRKQLPDIHHGVVVEHRKMGKYIVMKVTKRGKDFISALVRPDGSKAIVPMRIDASDNWSVV